MMPWIVGLNFHSGCLYVEVRLSYPVHFTNLAFEDKSRIDSGLHTPTSFDTGNGQYFRLFRYVL